MAEAKAFRAFAVATVAAAMLLAACGDDSGEPESEPDHAVNFDLVKQLGAAGRLTRQQVFRRLRATPLVSYEKLGPKGLDGPLFVCYQFEVEGGLPRDRAEACFRENKLLTSFGGAKSSAGGGPVPGAP